MAGAVIKASAGENKEIENNILEYQTILIGTSL